MDELDRRISDWTTSRNEPHGIDIAKQVGMRWAGLRGGIEISKIPFKGFGSRAEVREIDRGAAALGSREAEISNHLGRGKE